MSFERSTETAQTGTSIDESPSAAGVQPADGLTFVEKPALTEARLFSALHPELSAWFKQRFKHFSPAQRSTVPEVLAGRSTLLSSPTGTGKTLAAFLSVFDHLAKCRDAQLPLEGLIAVYVSPLRALTYDLQKNLQGPLDEMGWDFVRVGVRTGDTTPNERAAQRRKPPHILVTTPESVMLLLSQTGWLSAFRTVKFLIIDELHSLAENKRGSLLMVAAERLEDLLRRGLSAPPPIGDKVEVSPSSLIRIGLSATVFPLTSVAEYLVGVDRPCRIVEITQRKPAKIELFSPLRENPYPPAGWTGQRVIKELSSLVTKKRTTLIFTNVRSGAESIGLRLKQFLPELSDQIEVHHASLDRAVRLEVEDRLKRGELRAVVCSTSLEMGIDIGSIDTVVMVSAPKGVARALQRVGRSGHSMGEISHGVLVASNINDLTECAVTAHMMEKRELEPVKLHENPVDVLAQHLVGLAVFGSVTPDEAFALVRRAQPFRALPRDLFDRVIRYLEGGGVSLERNYRNLFGKVRLVDGVLTIPSPRVARDLYQNVGTILAQPMIQVRLGRRPIGEVEEWFIKGMKPGDIFVLNGRSLRLIETRLLTAKVAEAGHALPTIPRWGANKIPLGSGLATEVVRLRTEVRAHLERPELETTPASPTPGADWLISEYRISRVNAEAIERHFRLQATISEIPTSHFFLIECYPDRDLRHYFFHSLIGRAANDALARVIAWRVQQTRGGNALVTVDDYGFLLTLNAFQSMDVDAWKTLFARDGAENALRSALSEADLVKWQFRGVAQTGLMVPRRVRGEERGARTLQWSAEIIFDVLRRHEPDHPLLIEAYAEATLRFLDSPRALRFLEEATALPWRLRNVERVSPFAFGIFVSKIKETMTLEDPETTIERLYYEMYGSLENAKD